jgi:hypothetical protein
LRLKFKLRAGQRQGAYEVIFSQFIQDCDEAAYSYHQWNILASGIHGVNAGDLVPQDDQLDCRDGPDETPTANDSVENMVPASGNVSREKNEKEAAAEVLSEMPYIFALLSRALDSLNKPSLRNANLLRIFRCQSTSFAQHRAIVDSVAVSSCSSILEY